MRHPFRRRGPNVRLAARSYFFRDADRGAAAELDHRGKHRIGRRIVSALLDGEFALADGVPDLEVLVSATAGNLSVVGGESDGEVTSDKSNKKTGEATFHRDTSSTSHQRGWSQTTFKRWLYVITKRTLTKRNSLVKAMLTK